MNPFKHKAFFNYSRIWSVSACTLLVGVVLTAALAHRADCLFGHAQSGK